MNQPAPEDSKSFREVYALRGTEAIRWVPPPFIPERVEFCRRMNASGVESIPGGPDGVVLSWRDGRVHRLRRMFGQLQARNLILSLMNVYPQELDGDVSLATTNMRGDWIVNGDPDAEQFRAAIEKTITAIVGNPVTLTFRDVERPAIVFKGRWKARNADGSAPIADERPQCIDIYGANLSDPPTGAGNGNTSGDVHKFAKWAGQWIDKAVIVEALDAPPELTWRFRHISSGTREAARLCRDPALVCTHIAEQMGLDCKEETRVLRRLFIEYGA